MIEGGATVISTLLSEPCVPGEQSLTRLIVTIAPSFVGEDGVAVQLPNKGQLHVMRPLATKTFGRDVVVAYDFP